MTINNPEKFCGGLWDWGCLKGCFGMNIRPTDIDGFVERNGRFLLFETKDDGATIPKGQEITIRSLLHTGLFTVMVIWGKPQEPHKIHLFTNQTQMESPLVYENTSLDKLRHISSKWYEWADNQTPAPKFED